MARKESFAQLHFWTKFSLLNNAQHFYLGLPGVSLVLFPYLTGIRIHGDARRIGFRYLYCVQIFGSGEYDSG